MPQTVTHPRSHSAWHTTS